MRTLAERCGAIELLVLDVDGVLTSGHVNLAGLDVEVKEFHSRDGSGLKVWHDAGKQAAIISGRNAPAVTRRAAEVGIARVIQGAGNKLAALESILAELGLEPHQAAGMGDDLPDLPILQAVGLGLAVPDACPEVREAAHYVTQVRGGQGAVREAIELILRCQGRWQPGVNSKSHHP